MPLDDDLALPLSDEEVSRRKALSLIGSGALAIAFAGTGVTVLRYLEPSVVYEEDTRIALGRAEDIAVGTVIVLAKRRIYLVRAAKGFYALSSVCTHLGCITTYAEGAIACPCHGSRFALDGHVTAGPAPRPLPQLEVTLDRGLVVVDAGKHVAPGTLLEVA